MHAASCLYLHLILVLYIVRVCLTFAQDLVEAINQVRFERFDRVLHQVWCVFF